VPSGEHRGFGIRPSEAPLVLIEVGCPRQPSDARPKNNTALIVTVRYGRSPYRLSCRLRIHARVIMGASHMEKPPLARVDQNACDALSESKRAPCSS
jgi:hypothetical protein